jgi:hypothetical protein
MWLRMTPISEKCKIKREIIIEMSEKMKREAY